MISWESRRRRGPAAEVGLAAVAAVLLSACSTSRPLPQTASPTHPLACASAQASLPASVASADPLLQLASGLNQPDDVLYSEGTLYVGEYGSGRIAVLAPGQPTSLLPQLVPEVEGMAMLQGSLHVADQRSDTVLRLSGSGSTTVLRLTPVAGQEGLDGIAAEAGQLLVPDSPRGALLMVTPQGSVTRAVSGLVRPTGAWPLPQGGFLIADEYAGTVLRASPTLALTTLASGLPLVDDVAESPTGAVYAISLRDGTLLRLGGSSPTVVADHLDQPQGLTLDSAGNPVVTESGSGQVVEVVTTFQARPAAGVARLATGQALCVHLVRGAGFNGPVRISAKGGSALQPGSGDLGTVVPPFLRPRQMRHEPGGHRSSRWAPGQSRLLLPSHLPGAAGTSGRLHSRFASPPHWRRRPGWTTRQG